MKNFLRIYLLLITGIAVLYSTNLNAQIIKVAYATADVEMDASAVQPENDPIIQMLRNDSKFSVDVFKIDVYPSIDLNGYDLVIVQESLHSTSEILKQGQSLGLSSIEVPFIYNKAFALRPGRAFGDSSTGSAEQDYNIKYLKVEPENQSSELFRNIRFQDNTFDVFKATAWHSGEKNGDLGIQHAYDFSISGDNTLLGYGSRKDVSVCLNDIPAGTKIGTETLKARMIAMGMQFGPICADNGHNFTNEGLTLYRNAIYSLAGLEIPYTIVFSDSKTDKLPPVKEIQGTNNEFSVQLSWNYAHAEYLDHFEIWRGTEKGNLKYLAETSELTFVDEDVAVGDAFFYTIVIRGNSSDGLSSEEIQVVVKELAPEKPDIGVYESQNKANYMEWSLVPTSDLSHFRIYRGLDPDHMELLDSVDVSTTTYVDKDVINGTNYVYYITAVDADDNESASSTTIALTPYNEPPTIQDFNDFVVHDISELTIHLPFNLDKSSDGDGELVSFSWLLNGNIASTTRNPIIAMPQGTNTIKVTIEDNDGAKVSTTFKVFIDAGHYVSKNANDANAGITAISDNYIYVPEKDGKMQILDSDFKKVFDVSVPGEIRSISSVSTDTMMYLVSSIKTIYCFDKLGIPKWSLPVGGDVQSTPAIDIKRNRIYTGVSNNNLFGINRTTGVVEWLYRTKRPVSQPGVIIGSDSLLAITDDGEVLLFDLDAPIVDSQMKPIAQFSLNTSTSSAPAIDKEGNVYVPAIYGQFIKFHFNKTTGEGEIVWNKPYNANPQVSPSLGKDGTIYLGSPDSKLYAIDPSDGAEIWSLTLDAAVSNTATINTHGVVYVGTVNGTLYAISDNGIVLWKFESGSAIANATFFEEDNMYFSNAAGHLYKVYHMEPSLIMDGKSAALNNTPQWGTYLGNSRRSGVQAESLGILSAQRSLVENNLEVNTYPNPFKETFRLDFDLESPSSVRMNVFSMDGKILKSIDLGKQSAGKQSVVIPLQEVPRGMYFYQFMSNENTVSGKLIKQ